MKHTAHINFFCYFIFFLINCFQFYREDVFQIQSRNNDVFSNEFKMASQSIAQMLIIQVKGFLLHSHKMFHPSILA